MREENRKKEEERNVEKKGCYSVTEFELCISPLYLT